MNCTVKAAANPLRTTSQMLLLPIGSPAGSLSGSLAEADAAVGGAISRSIADGEIKGAKGEVTVFHASGRTGPRRIAVVGVGDGTDRETWEAAGRTFARAAAGARASRVTVAVAADVATPHAVALIEGIWLGEYRFEHFRGAAAKKDGPSRITDLAVVGRGLGAATLTRVTTIMARTAKARDLGNTPANHLTPLDLAAYAKGVAARIPGLTCKVLGVKDLEKLGAGGVLAVGQGSANPPCMIVMRWKPAKAKRNEVLGIVGKAVTFDTGGISIKPAGGMEEMKLDMCGGAIAIESIGAIAELGLPIETLAVIPSAENMPSSTAIKPGDVITAMNGKTIEVVNTDAEGRLILADALTYAARNGVTRMVEFSTLTGAMVVALGDVYAGLFGSDSAWTERVRVAGEATGDLAWPLPLHEGYRPLIKSDFADLSNAAKKRQAGGVYAAMFLREFTEGVPWCHLDIAGTATRGGSASGYGVRLVAELATQVASAT